MSQKLTIVLLTLTLSKLIEQLVQVVMCKNILVKINRELKGGSISLEDIIGTGGDTVTWS